MTIYNCPKCNTAINAFGLAEVLAKYAICPKCKARINLDTSDEEYLDVLRKVLYYADMPKHTYDLPTNIED